ncbi:MAG TPA: hypothetical protein VFY04_04035 [Solirubrobacterales bacterium]|nr:hypothetical protein [Solirubrobacterales bacterium]
MRTLRPAAGRLALAIACCATLLTAFAASAEAARPMKTGVSYVYENDPAAFEHVRMTGSTVALTPLRWGRIAPKNEPGAWDPTNPAESHYDWEEFDTWAVNAVNAGLTPVFQVRGAPLWAQRCSGASETDQPCNLDPGKLQAFATAAARRYSGQFGGLPRVRYWQGLNEPNLSLYFMPQYEGDRAVSPHLYRDLINAFYAGIKSVDPSNLVIAGGLGPIAVPKFTIGPMRFTRDLLCMHGHKRPKPKPGDCGGGVNFDIYDIHPYTTGSPAHEGGINDVQLGDLHKLKTLLRAADRAGRINSSFEQTPLWISELSWDSNPPDPGGLAMPILQRWAAEALFVAWRNGIDTFMWYSLRDGPDFPDTPSYLEPESGLFFRGATVAEDQPKPVMYSYRFPFVAYPREKGLRFWGLTPNGKGGKVTIQALRKGGWRSVGRVRADKFGIFHGLLRGVRYGRGKRGSVRAHYFKESSVPFSMRPMPDFRQPPFGAENAAG